MAADDSTPQGTQSDPQTSTAADAGTQSTDPGAPASDPGTQQSSQPDASKSPELKDPVFSVVQDTTAEVAAPAGGEMAIGGDGGGLGEIVNGTAKFAWDVIKDNRPVANQSSDNANAVPKGVDFVNLSGWSPEPRRLQLKFHWESVLGINATDLVLTCEWYYNGQNNGSGQYINAATVYATLDASWGNTFQVTASISNPLNLGTPANALAALPVRITIQQSNVLQNRTYIVSGQIKGNGGGILSEE